MIPSPNLYCKLFTYKKNVLWDYICYTVYWPYTGNIIFLLAQKYWYKSWNNNTVSSVKVWRYIAVSIFFHACVWWWLSWVVNICEDMEHAQTELTWQDFTFNPNGKRKTLPMCNRMKTCWFWLRCFYGAFHSVWASNLNIRPHVNPAGVREFKTESVKIK